ncbi:hypothetical protein BKA61DRAFT_583129 [Leptodontidium sp. MPI-SDFR-AT-0119]|nr:hypothetical protein BKA61DRAFT_583129 [Leptodontidium sp. MPI-SDFR-AT-0119]
MANLNELFIHIVLANGSIVDANATSHPDIYRALKGVASPPEAVFANFSGDVLNTYRVDSLLNFTIELAAPTGNGTVRKAFVTTTFKNNAENLQRFVVLCNTTIRSLNPIPELQFISSYQPFGQYISSHANATGGNLLGLDASDGDRVLVVLTVQQQGIKNNDTMTRALQKLIKDANELAVYRCADDDYLFMNYASTWQDVYGELVQPIWSGSGKLRWNSTQRSCSRKEFREASNYCS